MNRLRFILALLCAAAPVTLAAADTIQVRDASGRNVSISDPRRIVSIGGAVTEILYALGAENRIVAVDTTSLYPLSALKDKPNVGYMRQLSPEGVLGLSPTLVLAAEGAGPKEAVSVLEASAIPYVKVPEKFTAEDVIAKIRLVAAAAGLDKRGDCLVARVQSDLAALSQQRASVSKPARVIFVLSLADGRPMVSGRGTAADGMLRLAGAENAFSDFEGYKIVGEEAIAAAKPDAVLVMQRQGLDINADELFAKPGFALTPAAGRKALIAMEGLYLLGFGPRTASAARDLSHALYPSQTQGRLPSDSAAISCAG